MFFAFRRSTTPLVLLVSISAAGCNDSVAPAQPQFSGTYAGTYSGTGGCNDETVSGGISFTIEQEGSTLTVTYSLDPAVEGLTFVGGEASINTQSALSFSGTITQPSVVSGTFTGQLSAAGNSISGTVAGGATVLCSGAPQIVTFEADYQGTRQ